MKQLRELIERAADEEVRMAKNSGAVPIFKGTGPTSLVLFRQLLEIVQEQAREIERLQERVRDAGSNGPW